MAAKYWRGLVSSGHTWDSNVWADSATVVLGAGTLPKPGPGDIAWIDNRSGLVAISVPTAVTIAGLNLSSAPGYNIAILSLLANMQINGDIALNPNGNQILGNGFTISFTGNISGISSLPYGLVNGTASTGTLTLRANGTLVQNLRSNFGYIQLLGSNSTTKRIILETAKPSGILTFGFNSGLYLANSEFKYISGNPANVIGFLTAINGSTIDSGSIIFQSLVLSGTVTISNTNVNTELLQLFPNSNAIITSSTGNGIYNYGNFEIPTFSSIGYLETIQAFPSFIRFVGSANSTITFGLPSPTAQYVGVNLIFDKAPSAKTTLPNIMYWGAAGTPGSSWTHILGSGIIDGSTTTLYIRNNATNVTFDTNGIETVLNKVIILKAIGALTHNITLNSGLKFDGTLEIQNSAGSFTNFLGIDGFYVKNFTATNGTITLKANNNYTVVDGTLTLTGTSASRIVLKSDKSVISNGSITGTTLTLATASAVDLTGYRVSQYWANSPALRRLPAGLIFPPMDITTSAFLAEIVSGSGTTWTLDKPVTATVPLRGLMVGLPAYFEVVDCIVNISFITTFDIDSSNGNTVLVDNSYQNTTTIPNPNLWRTVNWNSLIPFPPLVTVAYVE